VQELEAGSIGLAMQPGIPFESGVQQADSAADVGHCQFDWAPLWLMQQTFAGPLLHPRATDIAPIASRRFKVSSFYRALGRVALENAAMEG
jgi:hypothetical protein